MAETVLVVEDDPSIATLLSSALEASGLDTRLARSGGEALSMAPDIHPQVILLDLCLPDISATRVSRGFPGVPTVVMSALPKTTVAAEAASIGAVAYFTKPFDLFGLVDEVRRVVSSYCWPASDTV